MKISKRVDGRYGAQIRTPDGKYKTVYGKTSSECRHKAYDLIALIESGQYVKSDRTLLSNWITDWIDGYLIGIKESTKTNYKYHLNNHIIPALGNRKIQSIERRDIQKLITMLYTKKGLAPKTVNNIYWTFHKCLDDAVKAGLINYNPSAGITLPKAVKPQISPLTEDDLQLFTKLIEGKRYEYVYNFLLVTGLRISELTGLTYDRVDMENKRMTIDRQLVNIKPIKFSTPKHDKKRTISLTDTAIQLIRLQKKRQAEYRLLIGDPYYNTTDLVFTEDDGRPCDLKTIYRYLKKITKDDFPKLRVHDLRHTYAILSIQAGIDIKTVQENLGHHSAAFTLDQYAFVTDGMRRNAADKFEKYVNLYVK